MIILFHGGDDDQETNLQPCSQRRRFVQREFKTKGRVHGGHYLLHYARRLLPESRATRSNANVADGGIRKGTRSDEIRPVIRRWPLPPLRPKRAASGVAGLRYGGGQRKTNHALMSETSAGKAQREAIPLNI